MKERRTKNRRVETVSKALTPNPKDLYGMSKISMTAFPVVATIHANHAMMNGRDKYGAYNWRDKPVIASIYVDAALRHLGAWFENEETAEDSGVHHLGHAIACCGILLDAQNNGNLIDDRPKGQRDRVKRLLTKLSKIVVKRRKAAEAKRGKQ